MAAHLAQRLVQGALTLLLLMVVVFTLVRATGSPVNLCLPTDASDEMRAELTKRLGLNQPLLTQFTAWAGDVLRLDFGTSLWQNCPAMAMVAEALPQTLLLGAITLAIAIVSGIVVVSLAALRPHGLFDGLAGTLSLAGASIPDV